MSNEKSSTVIDAEKKKATKLYNALVNDSKQVFYATDKITKTLTKKAENSLHKKDIVFENIYNGLENLLTRKLELFYKKVEKKDWVKWDYKEIKNLNKKTLKSLIKNLTLKCIALT